jgi:hypothetical protein
MLLTYLQTESWSHVTNLALCFFLCWLQVGKPSAPPLHVSGSAALAHSLLCLHDAALLNALTQRDTVVSHLDRAGFYLNTNVTGHWTAMTIA